MNIIIIHLIIYFFRPTMEINNSYGPLSMFFRGLMPNFNLDVRLRLTYLFFDNYYF